MEAVQIFDRKGKSLTNLVVLEVRVVGGSNIYFNKEDKAWVRRDAGNYMFKNGADLRDFIEQRKLYQRDKKEKSMKRKGRREGGSEGGSVEGGVGVGSVFVRNEERQKLFKQEYGDEGDGNYKMRERKPIKIKERNTLLRIKREKEKEEEKEKEKPIEEEIVREEVGVIVREEGQEEVDVLRRKIEELERLLWEERETRLKAATPIGEGEAPHFMLLPEMPVTTRMWRRIRRGKGKEKEKEKGKENEPECEMDKEDTNKVLQSIHTFYGLQTH